MSDILTQPNRDMRLLSPWFAERVLKAIAKCEAAGIPIQPFECWRAPERQDWLYAQGRTREGKVVTKAKAWESWHQLGLAQDCAKLVNGVWSWDFDPAKIKPYFLAEGLESLAPFEQCHFQMTGGLSISEARYMAAKSGLQGLWMYVETGKNKAG